MQTSTASQPTLLQVLTRQQWQVAADKHEARVARYADPFLTRRHRGEKHPVEDFLFTYYTLKPGQMKRWHPGAGVIVLDHPELARQKFYRPATRAELVQAGVDDVLAAAYERAESAAVVDTGSFCQRRAEALDFTREILSNTAAKPGFFGCFGMHEWAMAYKSQENNIRHEYLDLRLGPAGTDEVVERNRIRCSHFDAFRFFMPQASPMNELQPTRETQRNLEQPACLHANMDVYKWAYKLLPLVSSELLMDCFDLAWEVRELDMRAAPYDLKDWGYTPVKVETPEGKQEYVKIQRGFAARSVELRNRLLAVVQEFAPSPAPPKKELHRE